MPEEDAFCVFVKLMQDYRMREIFKPTMAELGLCIFQLESMLQVHHMTLLTMYVMSVFLLEKNTRFVTMAYFYFAKMYKTVRFFPSGTACKKELKMLIFFVDVGLYTFCKVVI